jgi:hypothetical protein
MQKTFTSEEGEEDKNIHCLSVSVRDPSNPPFYILSLFFLLRAVKIEAADRLAIIGYI